MNFSEVKVHQLHAVWDFVRRGLLAIIEKTGDDWLPEDIYSELRAGASALFLIDVGDEQVGFVVLQVWPQYHSGPRLFVRALWCEPGALVEHQEAVEQKLRELALKCGARAVRMNSPRRWDRAGWKLKQSIFEMEV